ncbi:lectin c-type domain-containing protein [Phthorimaea operculella]|nr:lectin c-type domain-containing protein [Phthorimaea operculella]
MFSCSVLLLALFASAQGRAVNISNTWVLPEEGFPVFYRYFRDRISWYEADAVCQFHHANLVTVDTTAQYDAVRAYLKELDISSAVWVGLIRSNPDGDFTWTDYRGLSGDGYWSAAPDARAAPLCAAADPSADYRWEARACGGPTVASFICELPVPQWALGNEGCMVRELPALTVLYLPESAAVQLTADCGLAGVKRVQCTGNVKRESLLKDLSCIEEDELTTTPIIGTEENNTSGQDLTTDSTDTETFTELPTEDDATTKHATEVSSLITTHETPVPVVMKEKLFTKKPVIINKLNNIYSKDLNLDVLHNNNLQSNDIPKLGNNENFMTIEQSEKLEDEKHMHHKMLHDELARLGNFETIFTQPTDHFVPPLVMAKAKISDDMTVLSLAEKHAQQMAEKQRFMKQNILNEHHYLKPSIKPTTEEPNRVEITDTPIVTTLQPVVSKESIKKDKGKSSMPKKYKEKFDDPKAKTMKLDGKLLKIEKPTSIEKLSTPIDITTKIPEVTATQLLETSKTTSEDSSLELTVLLKEPKIMNIKQVDDIAKLENIVKSTDTTPLTGNPISIKYALKTTHPDDITTTEKSMEDGVTNITPDSKNYKPQTIDVKSITDIPKSNEYSTEFPINTDAIMQDVVMNHEVIKITIVDDKNKTNPTHTIFEVTTLVPEFKDDVKSPNITNLTPKVQNIMTTKDESLSSTTSSLTTVIEHNETVTATETPINSVTEKTTEASSSQEIKIISTELPLITKTDTTTTLKSMINESLNTDVHKNDESVATVVPQSKEKIKLEIIGDNAEMLEIDSEHNSTDPDAIDDYNSPLLSGASEPIRRPIRSRRPKQNRPKFNPIRILG